MIEAGSSGPKPPENDQLLAAKARLEAMAGPLLSSMPDLGSLLAAAELLGSETPEFKSRLTEARYRTLLEQIPAVTFMASLERGLREVYVSPQIESLLGYTQREWLENPVLWYERLHPDDKDRWNVEFARTVSYGEHFHSVYRFLARDGRTVWILGDTKIVRDEQGRPMFIQGVGFDITELKKTEEELRRRTDDLNRANQELRQRTIDLDLANKELEAFSYSISHDLRTPLRGVEGFSHALLEDYGDKLDEKGRKHLLRVREAATRMARLIDEFLALYRITRKAIERSWIDLSQIARVIAEELKAGEPGRAVDFRIGPTRKAYGDPDLLGAALSNLLANAWKFTGKRARAVIEFGETVRDGKSYYFVRDNGIGFDMAYAGKLFKPFERLHKPHEYPGTGIGLATVQRVMERHGGVVFAEANAGQGATFYFSVGG